MATLTNKGFGFDYEPFDYGDFYGGNGGGGGDGGDGGGRGGKGDGKGKGRKGDGRKHKQGTRGYDGEGQGDHMDWRNGRGGGADRYRNEGGRVRRDPTDITGAPEPRDMFGIKQGPSPQTMRGGVEGIDPPGDGGGRAPDPRGGGGWGMKGPGGFSGSFGGGGNTSTWSNLPAGRGGPNVGGPSMYGQGGVPNPTIGAPSPTGGPMPIPGNAGRSPLGVPGQIGPQGGGMRGAPQTMEARGANGGGGQGGGPDIGSYGNLNMAALQQKLMPGSEYHEFGQPGLNTGPNPGEGFLGRGNANGAQLTPQQQQAKAFQYLSAADPAAARAASPWAGRLAELDAYRARTAASDDWQKELQRKYNYFDKQGVDLDARAGFDWENTRGMKPRDAFNLYQQPKPPRR